jgi:hypothetical protein
MPAGGRRAKYERQLPARNSKPTTSVDAALEELHVQLGIVTAEWHRHFDQLAKMDQNTREFDARFAEWERVDERYKRLCDRIDLLELSAHICQSSLSSAQTVVGQ